jgi:predicted Zn-dependent protease
MKYAWSHIEVASTQAGRIHEEMNILMAQGWKNVNFRIVTSDVEADKCIIEGKKPLTKAEENRIKRAKLKEVRGEIRLMKKLAKKHGYGLTPPGEDGQ